LNLSLTKAVQFSRWNKPDRAQRVLLRLDERSRTKPLHFARFRSFAINILRANGIENIARELYVNALNFNNALAYRFL
jgi:hypothetical protein